MHSSCTAGSPSSARSRSNAATNPASSSARITPRLPESDSGFTTHGSGASRATVRGSASIGATIHGGEGTPPAASRSRSSDLSRVAATASTLLYGRPSRWDARAATSVPPSSTATIASRGHSAANVSIASAAASGSPRGSATVAPGRNDSTAERWSEPTTTSTSSSAAAAMKSGAR